MMNRAYVEAFASDWIDAWNSHDLGRILDHYTDDFEMSSPVITLIAGEPSGTLKGKRVVEKYWASALALQPGLRFELVSALGGVNSITLVYQGPRGLAAEVFHLNHRGKVTCAYNHFERTPGERQPTGQ